MSEKIIPKIDTKNHKAVFLVKRRSTLRNNEKKTLNLLTRGDSQEKTYNADLQGIPQPV